MATGQKSSWGVLAFLVVAGVFGFVSVSQAFSALTITEVMYDVQGSDVGREWIEITNFTNEVLDTQKYLLFESGSNHKFSVAAGGSSLVPGASAILTKDPMSFVGQHPTYTGTIFKVSFSLSNTGEALVLKNASSTALDSVSYSASAGALGDGNSLHRTSKGIQAGEPTPGVYTETVTLIQKTISTPVLPQKIPVSKTKSVEKSVTIHEKPQEVTETTVVAEEPVPVEHKNIPKKSFSAPLIEGLLALLALSVLGAAAVWYAKGAHTLSNTQETDREVGEFEIEDR